MTETTTIPHGAEPVEGAGGKAFSYCCECGTYDAHATTCTCCGFDFDSDTASSGAE